MTNILTARHRTLHQNEIRAVLIVLERLVDSMLCSGMDKLVIALAVATLLSLASGQIDQDLLSKAFAQGESGSQCSDRHAGPCKLSSQCLPTVTPSNSTHLFVSWKDVFEGCREEHIAEAVLAFIEDGGSPKVIDINRGQLNVSVEADPCLQYTFQFLLFFTQSYEDTHGVQIARSAKNEYNKKGNENYLYGGLLTTEVLPNICLKENGTISTSDLPQALQYCGVAFSHVEGAEFHRCHSNCNHDDKETGQAAGRIPHICLFSPTDKNFG